MLRPNLAQDEPPAEISVGGISYIVDVDFRVWVDVLRLLRDLIPAPENAKQATHNIEVIKEIEETVFGKIIPQKPSDVLEAVQKFAEGYPEAPVAASGEYKPPTYSLDWDMNYIIIAIMNQFGIDLTYRRKEPFHWWLFLAYFRALRGEHYISRLMEIRGYSGKDAELKRQAQRYALPREQTAEDQAILDAFDALMEGGETNV